MSQHTRGPWKVETLFGDTYIIAEGGEKYSCVAKCPPRDGPLFCGANARLIAKAPEMYTLLQSCISYLDDLQNSPLTQAAVPDPQWVAPIRTLLRELEGDS